MIKTWDELSANQQVAVMNFMARAVIIKFIAQGKPSHFEDPKDLRIAKKAVKSSQALPENERPDWLLEQFCDGKTQMSKNFMDKLYEMISEAFYFSGSMFLPEPDDDEEAEYDPNFKPTVH